RLLSKKWYGEYRDADGILRCVPLSADKTASEQMLAELGRKEERVPAGGLTPSESRVSEHHAAPPIQHFEAYPEPPPAARRAEKRIQESRHHLDTVAGNCAFRRLADLAREPFERWLARQLSRGVSARTRNAYRESLVAFCHWSVDNDRLA